MSNAGTRAVKPWRGVFPCRFLCRFRCRWTVSVSVSVPVSVVCSGACFCSAFSRGLHPSAHSSPKPAQITETETGTDHRHRHRSQKRKPAQITETGTDHRHRHRNRHRDRKRIFRAAATSNKPTKHIGPDFRSSPSDCASEAAPGTASMHDLLRDMHQQIDLGCLHPSALRAADLLQSHCSSIAFLCYFPTQFE